MATYAIGDIQGCHRELLDLLDTINFDGGRDQLWFCGDLVNRGPSSLETLRLVKSLDTVTVLGNHDLHLLAVASGKVASKKKDTLDPILAADDREELLAWLRQRPLLHEDPELGYVMVHAGLPPQWDLTLARDCARELESVIRGDQHRKYFTRMYGDTPDLWSEKLTGWERYRFITNCLTRIRYCDEQGRMTLRLTGPPGSQPVQYLPWFRVRTRRSRDVRIVFGHWATILLGNETEFESANVFPLDSGCVWGGKLTALRLEDRALIQVPSRQKQRTR